MAQENIVHAPDIQKDVFNNLLEEMQKQGQLIQPQLPDGSAVDPNKSQPMDEKTAAQKTAAQAPQAIKPKISGGNNVTDAIANQGQLIQTAPQISAGGADDGLSDIKRAINWLAGDVQSSQSDTAAAAKSSGSSGGGGLGGIGDILDVAASVIGWIICTELVRQHRLSRRYYYPGGIAFSKYPEIVKEGYYLWAIPSVRHLRAHPHSWYSNLLECVFGWRAENIAAYAGVLGARKLKRGAAVTVVLWPICFLLGCGLYVLNLKQCWLSVYGGK